MNLFKRGFLPLALLLSMGIGLSMLYFGVVKTLVQTLIIVSLILFNLWFIYLLIIPKEYGRLKYRRITVAIAILLFGIFVFLNKSENSFIITQLKKVIPSSVSNLFHFSQTTVLIVVSLIILGIILFLINSLLQDKTVMGEHRGSIDDIIPERDYNEKLESFTKFLKNRIDNLDAEANWSDAHFTPIEAEVESYSKKGKKSKITNFLKAIKNDRRSKVFLILGEPGSGKSVALRKLCRDLTSEVKQTKKIPIYLNLKEWATNKVWSENDPPAAKDLQDFCISYLKGKDVFADEFIDKYFKRLYENGYLFFIIDSFDEIPSVLDVDESSWLIDKFSEALYDFLGGAHESRGVLSSRYFRKPTSKFRANSVLNIRPFSEYKIYQALNKYILIDQNIIKSIFRERSDLLPIASNPFSVGLVYAFLKNNNKLPLNQADLYSSYIENRLNTCSEKISRYNITKEIVINYATDIAIYMFNQSNFGLEISFDELKSKYNDVDIEKIIDILVYARIGRIGKGDEKRFSFVHRRFNEYFVIQQYQNNPSIIDLEVIPQDSRYRDALVLYCEVAPSEVAQKIVAFCWNEIQKINTTEFVQLRRSIHSLRFLIEAFRTRTSELEMFNHELGELIFGIAKNYKNSSHPLITKIAIEAVGIVDQENMEKTLVECFNINNVWLNNTALNSCRFLNEISKRLRDKIYWTLTKIEYVDLLNQKDDLLFSLKLSESFKSIRRFAVLKLLDVHIFFASFILIGILNPPLGFSLAAVILAFFFMESYIALSLEGNSLLGSVSSTARIMSLFYGYSLAPLIKIDRFSYLNNFWHINDKVFNQIIQPTLILSLILFFPWLDFIVMSTVFFKNFKRIIEKVKEISTYRMLGSILIIVAGGGIVFLGSKVKAISYLMIGISGLAVITFVYQFLSATIDDFKKYKRFKLNKENARELISGNLTLLKTEYFRYKYILYLQKNVLNVEGDWPLSFSLVGNSKSLVLLAQLDEVWLGLG